MSFLPVGSNVHRERNLYFPFDIAGAACVNGPLWTQRVAASTAFWRCLAYGAGVFVAGGATIGPNNAVMQFSTDFGVTWQASGATGTIASFPPAERSLAFGAGLFVAMMANGANASATSPDGNTWTARASPGSPSPPALSFGGGLFHFKTGAATVFRSVDGINWLGPSSMGASSFGGIGFGGGVWVAPNASAGGIVTRSTDGINWVAQATTSPLNASTVAPVAFGNGVFVAASSASVQRLMLSTDLGLTWQQSNVLPGGVSVQFTDLLFSQGVFYAVGDTGANAGQRIFTSTNGLDWVAVPALNLLPNVGASAWKVAADGLGHYAGEHNTSGGDTIMASGVC